MVDGLYVLTWHGTKSTLKDNEWCQRRPLARSIGNSRYHFLSEEKEVLVNRLNEVPLHTCMDGHMEMIWAEWSKSFVSSIRTTVLVDIPGIVDGPNSYIFLYRTGYRRCPWMKNVVSSTRRSFSNYLEGPGPPYSCTCSLQRRIPPHPVIDSVIGVTDDCSLFWCNVTS